MLGRALISLAHALRYFAHLTQESQLPNTKGNAEVYYFDRSIKWKCDRTVKPLIKLNNAPAKEPTSHQSDETAKNKKMERK